MNRIKIGIAVTSLLIGLAILVAYWLWPRSRQNADAGDDPVEDPRVTFSTPFRNVRPEVKYVGDAACANCHREQTRSFHHHPMGRSMATVAEVAPQQRYDSSVRNPFDALGASYRVDRQLERLVHEEIRKDTQGNTLTQAQAEVAYVLGSGARARSYLIRRGDALFESPITWFVDEQRWNISPGYERVIDRFERPVQPECLFCHSNPTERVEDTINRYKTPLFPHGASIGCERCHGPGELHVKEQQDGIAIASEVDYSIVNPRHLEPALREAVCEQCHLEAERRILRRGREVFDYRPGLPFYLFWSDFLRLPELDEHGKFVGKVEQMYSSQCFKHSGGEMGCSTCHDAHSLPEPAKKTTFYRDRCMSCHRKKDCSLPQPERQKNGDNCVACHMPRTDSTDISHTAISDHRILRRPEKTTVAPVPRKLRLGEVPLVHFHKDDLPANDPEVARDLGLALVELARLPTPLAAQLGDTALPYLDGAISRGPHDAAALLGRAYVLFLHGRHREALQLADKVLARSPNHETALEDAVSYADNAGERERAIEYSTRLIAVNRHLTRYRVSLIRLLTLQGEFDRALADCRETLHSNPASVAVRSLLVTCYLKTGQIERAREEFTTLVKLNPPNKDELIRWFQKQIEQAVRRQ